MWLIENVQLNEHKLNPNGDKRIRTLGPIKEKFNFGESEYSSKGIISSNLMS